MIMIRSEKLPDMPGDFPRGQAGDSAALEPVPFYLNKGLQKFAERDRELENRLRGMGVAAKMLELDPGRPSYQKVYRVMTLEVGAIITARAIPYKPEYPDPPKGSGNS